MFLLPQRPYIPLGPLRRAAIYPKAAEEVDDATVKNALTAVGLAELVDRVDEDRHWDQTLSGGEKQRLAFARLLIDRPDIAVMDEATSALDEESQQDLMALINKELPNTTIVSVGHRQQLEAFHDRKIVLEYQKGGTRIVSDEPLLAPEPPKESLLRRILRARGRYLPPPPPPVPDRNPSERIGRG